MEHRRLEEKLALQQKKIDDQVALEKKKHEEKMSLQKKKNWWENTTGAKEARIARKTTR
jgi:hypothetical protein